MKGITCRNAYVSLPSMGYVEGKEWSPTAFRIDIIIRSEVLGRRDRYLGSLTRHW
jgi:hypothetical protein